MNLSAPLATSVSLLPVIFLFLLLFAHFRASSFEPPLESSKSGREGGEECEISKRFAWTRRAPESLVNQQSRYQSVLVGLTFVLCESNEWTSTLGPLTSTSRSIFTLVIRCTRDTKRYHPIHTFEFSKVVECSSSRRDLQPVGPFELVDRTNESLGGPGELPRRNGMTGTRLSSVVFLALVSLSPCLAQRLEDDKDDFTETNEEATGLLESPSRRPRALAFPKNSQLLVRTKTAVKIDEG